MTNKIISLLLVCALFLTSCTHETNNQALSGDSQEANADKTMTVSKTISAEDEFFDEANVENLYNLNDVEFLEYVEDKVYAEMTDQFASEDYKVESVDAIYISKEYLEELSYNSKENVYFGYTLAELDAQYSGERYVFTLGEDGKTTTKVFEKYDDTYDRIIHNVLVGAGVIVVCVTVSVCTGGTGVPTCISMVFATSAKTGAAYAASSGVISFAGTAIVKGIETKNVEETLKQAALSGSEGFKWGAITGVVAGGVTKTLSLVKSSRTVHSYRNSEVTVLERTKGGKEQVSFLNGKEVTRNTKGATRPDIIVTGADGTLNAIEVKNYNLLSSKSRSALYREIKRQVESRAKNLPKGSKQKIVLDIRGRKIPKKLLEKIIKEIKARCYPYYRDIPVETLSY